MKLPKQIRTYCSKCKKHTVQTVSILRANHKRRKLSWSGRSEVRRDRGHGGHGRFSKIPVTRIARKSKTTRKTAVKLTCRGCGKASIRSLGRARKAEFIS